jgi:hypothetical protein
VVLLLLVVLGHAFCDPQFYHYAGELAAGRWPYRDVAVEYPPLAMALILMPALPLLAFPDIAPRHDAAFTPPLTHLPHPDPVRYGAYATSFAVELLLLDALTLLLVCWAAPRLAAPGQSIAVRCSRAGLLYVAVTFACGALLQKFDLVAGTAVLAAVALLVSGRIRLAWAALALATLIKGFPLLAAPLFTAYMLMQAELPNCTARGWIRDWLTRLVARRAALAAGLGAFIAVLVVGALPVLLTAGPGPLLDAVLYHAGRGTEIESLYGNVLLLSGRPPGMAVTTAFSGADLSRVVRWAADPSDLAVASVSVALLAVALLVDYVAFGVALGKATARVADAPTKRGRSRGADWMQRGPQVLVAGVVGALLAFLLTFRALPLHYLLVVAPLVAVSRLRDRRSAIVFWAAVFAVAILGQALTIASVWRALVLLEPWAVGVLTLRNAAWIAVFALVIWALWSQRDAVRGRRGGATVRPTTTVAPPQTGKRSRMGRRVPPHTRARNAWRRLVRATPPIPGFTPRAEDVAAHLLSRVPPLTLLLVAGLTSTLLYLGLTAAFPITVWWSHPQLAVEMGRVTGYSPFAAGGYVFTVLALFACQFLALWAAGRLPQMAVPAARVERLARRAVLLFPIAFVAILIWMQPITTTDLYGYVARGYLFAHLHLNPMLLPAKILPGGLTDDRPAAPYGPLWILIAAGITRICGESLLANMLLFKLIAAAATVGSMALVDGLARRLMPARRLRAYVLFAWSPLLLFEAIGNGHNDIAMMLCVLLAFALMLRGHARTAFAFLILGALIKYVSLVIVPLWLVYELRQRAQITWTPIAGPKEEATGERRRTARWKQLIVSLGRSMMATLHTMNRREATGLLASAAAIAGVLFVGCYAPFWAGMRTFTGLGQQLKPSYYNSSIVQFIAAPLQLLVPPHLDGALDKTVRLVFYAIFAGYALLQAQRLWAKGIHADMRDVITGAGKTIFAALVLITFWFQPWYVVWLLPLAALASQSFVRRQGTLLAAGALLTYAISDFLPVGTSGIGRDLFVQFFEILVTFCPLLLLRPAAPEEGWGGLARRYAAQLGEQLRVHPEWWERVMLALILIVAALLRVLSLGNPFAVVNAGSSGALQQLGGDLKLYLSDPRGLHGPFVALQGVLVHIFGSTPFAALLPSAIIGTITVFVVYLLALEVTRQASPGGQRGVALLAALFAATSDWHVSLSRSGMEVVLLPLLVSTGIYWLLLGLRLNAARHGATGMGDSAEPDESPQSSKSPAGRGWLAQRDLACFAGCGVVTGLACDIAPGLWLLPLLVTGTLLVWRWRLPKWFISLRVRLAVLMATAMLTGLPALWSVLSNVVGFPKGSSLLAHSTTTTRPPNTLSPAFWAQVASNAGGALRILVAQDYSAGYPANGGTPILPIGMGWLFFLGVALIIVRWRDMTSLAALLLLALPLLSSIAVGTPAGIVEAAAVLPATCIVPALALRALGGLFAHLPIVLDRVNGARVFSSPEQIGRILLLVFLLISTMRTFFWYFAATLPSTPPNSWIPT